MTVPYVISINVPVVYMARDVMILTRANDTLFAHWHFRA
jgi:hypothetical protein